jgi:caffeoyl-CoA O-methyltransferase
VTGVADDAVEHYAQEHTTPLPPELVATAGETAQRLGSPEMLSGPVVGRLLDILVHALAARLVLEIGTFSGVSAMAMAARLAPGGRLITCELDPERAEFARRQIDAAGFSDRIEVRLGPALETIAEIPGPIDLVFIDADKTGYLDYYEAVLPKLAAGGLIVADNTLRDGRVLDGEDSTDPGIAAIVAFNERVAHDERVVATLLTVRDGVTLIRRAA